MQIVQRRKLFFDVRIFVPRIPIHPHVPHDCICEMLCRYLVVYDTHPKLLKLWAPVVWYTVAALVVAMEIRMLVGYTANR
jgi:hypothetical protein